MNGFLIGLLLLLCSSAHAQQTIAPIDAKTSGACSPNIIGNKGEISITCNGITDEKTTTKLIAILNVILRKQSDPKRMESKLDEILAFVRNQSQETAAVKAGIDRLASRDHYRPLAEATKATVVEGIKHVVIKYGNTPIVVSVYAEIGSQNRQQVAKELSEVLKLSGVQVEGPQYGSTYPSTGAVPLPAVALTCNPSDWNMAAELVESWQRFLKVRVQGRKSDTSKPGRVSLSVWGEPLFEQDGSVTFR